MAAGRIWQYWTLNIHFLSLEVSLMLVKPHNIDNKQAVSQRERLYDMFSVKINTAYGKNVKDRSS